MTSTISDSVVSGGCLCGAVRYRVTGRPVLVYHCHCSMCRRASGASFVTNMLVAAEHFQLVVGVERLASFESSTGKLRHFCNGCGSPIFSRAQRTLHLVSVRCGTLDLSADVEPEVHAFVQDKAPWVSIRDGLPCRSGALR